MYAYMYVPTYLSAWKQIRVDEDRDPSYYALEGSQWKLRVIEGLVRHSREDRWSLEGLCVI